MSRACGRGRSKTGSRLSLFVFVCIAIAAAAQAATPAKPFASLDAFVPAQMQKWKLPGLAIAVVQHGKVIYSNGFGLRDVKQNLPVTTTTLFAIGSVTKSFTSVSMGILNDEGKFDWDKPVRDYIPEFQMYDPEASERMTPRDLISHRTGFAGHDLVWYSSNFTREDLVHRLRFLQSTRNFRSGYNYNNLLVMTAGYLVGKISGGSWEDFVKQRIFDPLQMSSSNFTTDDLQKNFNYSHPYIKDEDTGEVHETPYHALSSICPAGCINSNVEDMARYAIFQLGNGRVGDRQIISEANLKLTHTAQVPMGGESEFKEIGLNSYAMGWVVTSYRGHRLIWHNGGIDGFYSLVTMLPDENLAVVILTNRLGQPVPEIAAYRIFDQVLGLNAIDWSARYDQIFAKAKEAEAEAKKAETAAHKSGTHPSHELKDYTDVYENPGYGTITIALSGDQINMKLNEMELPLQQYHYDVFQVPEKANWILGGSKLRFQTNMDGNIDSIAMPLEGDALEIIFSRQEGGKDHEK